MRWRVDCMIGDGMMKSDMLIFMLHSYQVKRYVSGDICLSCKLWRLMASLRKCRLWVSNVKDMIHIWHLLFWRMELRSNSYSEISPNWFVAVYVCHNWTSFQRTKCRLPLGLPCSLPHYPLPPHACTTIDVPVSWIPYLWLEHLMYCPLTCLW